MRIEIIPCLQDNYSYLIIDESNNFACVVDPSEAEPIINFLRNKNLKLKYILNTHHHYDHIGGNQELKKKYGSVVVGFKGDSKRIPGIDILLEDNQIGICIILASKFSAFHIWLSSNKMSIPGILSESALKPTTTDPYFFFSSLFPPI